MNMSKERTQGRPSKYKEEFNEQAKELCLLGAIDADLARFFKVSIATIHNWKNEYPEFKQALDESKTELDSRVVRSLFERAIGYKHEAEEIKVLSEKGVQKIVKVPVTKHYPPEVVACIFWLKNRQPELWREKQAEIEEPKSDKPIKIEIIG